MVGNVRSQFGRCLFQDGNDRLEDGLNRFVQGLADFLRVDIDRRRQARFRAAAADIGCHAPAVAHGRADEYLQLFCCVLTDGDVLDLFQIADNRFVKSVAANAQGFADDDAAQAEDGDVCRPTAHVDDHGTIRRGNVQTGADSGSQRFFHDRRLAGTGLHGRFDDGPPFDVGDARRDADDDAGFKDQCLADGLADEVAQHVFRRVVVGDDAVAQRMVGVDVTRRPPQHSLGFAADGDNFIFHRIDGNDGRFIDDNAPVLDEHDDIGRSQVDSDIAAEPVGQKERVGLFRLYSFLSFLLPQY